MHALHASGKRSLEVPGEAVERMTGTHDARATFLSFVRCKNVKRCLETNEDHPCREIVEYQVRERGVKGYADFQLPEPWVVADDNYLGR